MVEQKGAMATAEQMGSGSGVAKSTFTPFLSETARVQALKTIYLDRTLEGDLGVRDERLTLIRLARNILAEVDGRLTTAEDVKQLNKIINGMKLVDKNLLTVQEPTLLEAFEDEAYAYITNVNQVLQRAGQGFKLSGQMSELDTLAKALGADVFYPNALGIPIHYAMWEQARFMANRIRRSGGHGVLDNFWGVEGQEGYGKSTVAIELATTIAQFNGVEFDINKHLILSEKKEYVYEVFRKRAKFGEVYIFDEAVNQASKKRWWQEDQVEVMRQFTLMRYLGITALFCIPTINDLDVVLRNRRLQGVVSIPELPKNGLGTINVKLPNLNPAAQTYDIEKYAKKEVVTSPEELADFVAAFDKNRIMSYSFLEIPQNLPIWTQYMALKNSSFRTRKMEKTKKFVDRRPLKEQMMLGFLTAIDPNVATINAKQVEAYGTRIGYKLNFDSLARYIARNTGLTPTEIIKFDAESKDVNKDAYIDLNEEHVHAFVTRIRNTPQGERGVGV